MATSAAHVTCDGALRKAPAAAMAEQRLVDVASLAAFRIGFGLLLLIATLRYFAHGWIAEYFVLPRHFFSYWGFGWVKPWPGVGMYVHFALMALCAFGIALGYRYRASVLGFGVLFAYAHLIDKTNYLNHYYLVICVCALMACLPLNAQWSLDARRDPRCAFELVPAWMLGALRAQFGLVYLFGGVAKLNRDWLVAAEPLSIWLARRTELPVLGPLLAKSWAPYAMSWGGACFDLAIVPLLLFRRTRPVAFMALVTFHLVTATLFSIGMFPFVMICGALLFLPPDWPRLLGRGGVPRASLANVSLEPSRWLRFGLVAYFLVQLFMPLRQWLYPGNVCWTEQGFRFSWNVMLMEKDGSLEFRVVEPSSGRVFYASPRDYFTPYQTAMLAPQPDMVLQAAHVVAEDFRARGIVAPAVYADAFASLNGRALQRLVNPHVDLAKEVDGLSNKAWILPMQEDRMMLTSSLNTGRR